ncbi:MULTISPECIES: hypothetical protein [unclassified Saccharopolyspora]|uniref:hypothetical protein n=1 Tax=unclassified Saccharopolyspora TaxID=2646250 RepID=UPI001CD44333|nr:MULTISPECIES: hypothetical protein [unclassified Saccharopolyspora]MCA1190152.1 hypothetical protein [Saccharopolyspora sp. 6T]MCA1194067.1 hypothetical protein [Saccharopolyspora sp. 6V]MCA1281048.1 hypothetical protein [Saccharopolyspora sp. 7B]
MSTAVLAHGLGGRTDLPLNGAAAVVGGALAVAVSFLALVALWSKPWLDPEAGRPVRLPVRHDRLLGTVRIAVLLLAVFVVAVGAFGPAETNRNLAPWVLFVTFWVGLIPVSVLFGPVWRAVNPLRTLLRLLRLGRAPRPLPPRLGYRVAAAWLLGFVWLELVAPDRADPRLVTALIVGYAVVNLAAAARYGPVWFERGDGFEVYSTLLARFSPLGRRADGTVVLRNPLAGLVRADPVPGLAGLACVLIGSTAFDGFTRTSWWQALRNASGLPDVLVGSGGLLVCVTGVSALYFGSMRWSARLSGSAEPPAARFAATLLPIAVGYGVAHYFSFFVIEGQQPFILAGDPFGTGLDLFGSAGNVPDYSVLSPGVVAMVQINAIVLGHIASTAAAHDQALRLFDARGARVGQLPVVLAMVFLTGVGLLLLLSG